MSSCLARLLWVRNRPNGSMGHWSRSNIPTPPRPVQPCARLTPRCPYHLGPAIVVFTYAVSPVIRPSVYNDGLVLRLLLPHRVPGPLRVPRCPPLHPFHKEHSGSLPFAKASRAMANPSNSPIPTLSGVGRGKLIKEAAHSRAFCPRGLQPPPPPSPRVPGRAPDLSPCSFMLPPPVDTPAPLGWPRQPLWRRGPLSDFRTTLLPLLVPTLPVNMRKEEPPIHIHFQAKKISAPKLP